MLLPLVAMMALTVQNPGAPAQSSQPAQGAAQQQAQGQDQISEQAVIRIVRSIQKEVMSLPNYGVFDWITFSLDGYNVILKGYASRPTLKESVERVVKGIEGVAAVENRIETLPTAGNDDRVRTEAYFRIYGNRSLSRYNPNRGSPLFLSPTRVMTGLTLDPPIGFHPIHIIVKNGNITLFGTVLNEADKAIAGMSANQVSGSFKVDNELGVEMADHKKSYKPPKK